MRALAILEKEGVYAVCSQDDFGLSMLVTCAYLTKKYGLRPIELIPWAKMMVPGCLTAKQISYYKVLLRTPLRKSTSTWWASRSS